LPIQTIIGRAIVLLTMRSSGEVQPPGAVHGAGMDPAKAHLQRQCFRSKVSWHGGRHWRPAANWIPQPRSARIHWIGVSRAFKESTDGAISSKSCWLASTGSGGHCSVQSARERCREIAHEVRPELWGRLGRARGSEIIYEKVKLTFRLSTDCIRVRTAPGRVKRLLGPPLGRSRSYNPLRSPWPLFWQ